LSETNVHVGFWRDAWFAKLRASENRATTTAADSKRDARAAPDKGCADRMKGMQSGGDLNFTLLSSGCITDPSSDSLFPSPLARDKAPLRTLSLR
jgi:hypothetical protein